jgi:hypothetical protein
VKSNSLKYFVIGTFVTLYLVVSVISTIHVVQFFDLTNPKWLSISLAIAFELGAAASLASIIALDKMNKFLVWALFIVLTAMQAMGNTYYAYINIGDFKMWSELFGLIEEDLIYQKRILSIISGAILPLVALGFIKSLVDYIKPEPADSSAEADPFEPIENKSEVEELQSLDIVDLGGSGTLDSEEEAKDEPDLGISSPQIENQVDQQEMNTPDTIETDGAVDLEVNPINSFPEYNSDAILPNNRNEYQIDRSKWRPRG